MVTTRSASRAAAEGSSVSGEGTGVDPDQGELEASSAYSFLAEAGSSTDQSPHGLADENDHLLGLMGLGLGQDEESTTLPEHVPFTTMATTMEGDKPDGRTAKEGVAPLDLIKAELKSQVQLKYDQSRELLQVASQADVENWTAGAWAVAVTELPEWALLEIVEHRRKAGETAESAAASRNQGKATRTTTAADATGNVTPAFTPPTFVTLADVLHDPKGPGGEMDLLRSSGVGATFASDHATGRIDLDRAARERPWIIHHPPQPCSEDRDPRPLIALHHKITTSGAEPPPTVVPPQIVVLGAWPEHAGAARRCQNHVAHPANEPHFTCNRCENFCDRLLRVWLPALFASGIWLPTCQACSRDQQTTFELTGAGRCTCPVGEAPTWSSYWIVLGRFYCLRCRLQFLVSRIKKSQWMWGKRSQGRRAVVRSESGALVETLAQDHCQCASLLDGGHITLCPQCGGINVDSLTGPPVYAMNTRRG